MQTGQTVGSLAAHKMQVFVAGHSAAFACICKEQRAGPAADRTGEEGGAVESYGTVRMNYIQFSADARSGEGASGRYSDVEPDNQVFTGLARKTSVMEAGVEASARGFGFASLSVWQR